jgi:hypothetical protein
LSTKPLQLLDGWRWRKLPSVDEGAVVKTESLRAYGGIFAGLFIGFYFT